MKTVYTKIDLMIGNGGKGELFDFYDIRTAKRELLRISKTDNSARVYYYKEGANSVVISYDFYKVVNGKIIKENINYNN